MADYAHPYNFAAAARADPAASLLDTHTALGPSVPFSLHYLVGEIASAAALLGTFAAVLPAITTIMAVIWYTILIYESRTFRKLFRLSPYTHEEKPEAPEHHHLTGE